MAKLSDRDANALKRYATSDNAMLAFAAKTALELHQEIERLTRELAEEKAAHRETFETARKFIVSDEPPSEEAMRYGREVVAPRLEHGPCPEEACIRHKGHPGAHKREWMPGVKP